MHGESPTIISTQSHSTLLAALENCAEKWKMGKINGENNAKIDKICTKVVCTLYGLAYKFGQDSVDVEIHIKTEVVRVVVKHTLD